MNIHIEKNEENRQKRQIILSFSLLKFMDQSFDEESILQEIQRLVTVMTSANITHADICDYNKSKHQIISYSRNIYFLINILKNEQDLSKQVVLEILNIIYSIICTSQTTIDLQLILKELLECEIEDLALIQTLGKSVAFISELLFISEEGFELPIEEERDSISPLEDFVFDDFLNYFSVYSYLNSKKIKDSIKKNIIPKFLKFGVGLLPNQPIQAITIIKNSLFFGIDQKKLKQLNQKLTKIQLKWAYEYFYPPEFFQCLSEIAVTGPEDAALNALEIVTIIARSLDNWIPSAAPIIENIQQFVLSILQDESILDDQIKAYEIHYMLININPETKLHPFDEVIEFLYQLTQNVLQNSPLLLTIIYPGILTFFKSFKGKSSREGFYEEFLENLKLGFVQYVDALLNSFDSNTDQTAEQVFDKGNLLQIDQSLTYLLEYSDLSDIPLYIKDKILEIVNDEITIVNSYKISFILIVLNSYYVKFDIFSPECEAILFDLLFELIPLMQEKLPEYLQLANASNTTFYIAEFFLLSISTLLKKNFINMNQSDIFDEFKEFCSNSNMVEIISTIFNFLLFMLQNDLEIKIASIVMKDILKTQSLCKLLADETDIPNYFLENYTLLPCKTIYYFAIITLIGYDEAKLDDFFKKLTAYLSEILSDKPQLEASEQIDHSESIRRFLKIISTFLDSSFESDKSFQFFEYIFNHFGELIEKISGSEYWKYVLKFITKLTETKNGNKRLPDNIKNYPTTSPYTFKIFQFFCLLLTNILKNIELNQLDVDESIFLSAIPTLDIYLNMIQISNHNNESGEGEIRTEVEGEIPPSANDEGDWQSLSKNLKAMNLFLISPFPHFAIMQYYEDNCLLDYFDVLIGNVQKTSYLSLLSVPDSFDPLLTFVQLLTESYFQIILETESFMNFILVVTRVAFLSNNLSTLSNSCSTIEILNKNLLSVENANDLKCLFEQHYILALNLLTIPKMNSTSSTDIQSENEDEENGENSDENFVDDVKNSAASFIYWFMLNDLKLNDFEFVNETNKKIIDGIEADEIKELVDDVLTRLINDVSFSGRLEDKKRFDEAIKYFCDVFTQNSLRLDYIPSISDFFCIYIVNV